MRLKRHVELLESTLRHVGTRPVLPALSSPCTRSRYNSTTSAAYPERIAVLGGGVAGLASAYFVSREFPNSKVTVYEAGKDAGGWLKSVKKEVSGGEVLFELGPRTLRNATVTAHLCQELGLVDDITYTKKTDPAAKNRYVYYPDQLNRLPAEAPTLTDLFTLWRTGVMAGAFGMIREPLIHRRPDTLTDETVGSFISRRVDSRIADNLVSAVFHGIYAGDIYQLSAKTLLSGAWQLEGRYGSALAGYFTMNRQHRENGGSSQVMLAHPYDLDAAQAMNDQLDIDKDLMQDMHDASTFTFKGGLQQLARTLQAAVERTGNVEIKTNSPVTKTEMLHGERKKVAVNPGQGEDAPGDLFDLVISTLREPSLTPFVTVQTINLYYSNPSLLSHTGFGYLIPRSIPFAQNPERALGVIFDSYATHGQDSVPGTKLTVMMGGHWWDGFTAYPDEEEALHMAKNVLERHLGITDEPAAYHVNLSKDCIPQYTLGYEDRLQELAQHLGKEYRGRMRVVGNQVNGVGVNDVIQGAWNLVRGLKNGGWKNSKTGLERVTDDREWSVVPAASLGYHKKR